MDMLFNSEILHPDNFNPRIFYIIKESVTSETKTYDGAEYATLIYVLSGRCTYIINDVAYVAKKGDIIIVNPYSSHKKIPFQGETVEEFNIGFVDINIGDLPQNYLISNNSNPIITLTKYHSQFHQCCIDILKEGMQIENGSRLIMKAIAMKLIALFLKEIHNASITSTDALPVQYSSTDKKAIVQTIIKFMNENYMNDITLESISKNMYFSSVYISKIFKDEIGKSPINHLIRIRLSKARHLLESQPISIKEAAKAVGYNDAYYFSKLFKKYYDVTPSSVMYKRKKDN